MNATLAIQILPRTKDYETMIETVDQIIRYIQSTGVTHTVGPLETTMEGDFDTLMDIAKQCQLLAIAYGANSVSAYIKVIYNPSQGVLSIAEKTDKY